MEHTFEEVQQRGLSPICIVAMVERKKKSNIFFISFYRIGVAFTGSSGDTMEIKTFGKFEKYVSHNS